MFTSLVTSVSSDNKITLMATRISCDNSVYLVRIQNPLKSCLFVRVKKSLFYGHLPCLNLELANVPKWQECDQGAVASAPRTMSGPGAVLTSTYNTNTAAITTTQPWFVQEYYTWLLLACPPVRLFFKQCFTKMRILKGTFLFWLWTVQMLTLSYHM